LTDVAVAATVDYRLFLSGMTGGEGAEMDRLAAMETFVRVIEAGSFSSAAKQLRVGQPAVSKTIAQLEDRLGVRLLLRSTHRLTPTDAGRDFYERAKRSIEDVEEAEAAARGAAVTLSGRLAGQCAPDLRPPARHTAPSDFYDGAPIARRRRYARRSGY
jgi:DNA-binding transcriptional LysR family regulator